jgi:hypothetical protein
VLGIVGRFSVRYACCDPKQGHLCCQHFWRACQHWVCVHCTHMTCTHTLHRHRTGAREVTHSYNMWVITDPVWITSPPTNALCSCDFSEDVDRCCLFVFQSKTRLGYNGVWLARLGMQAYCKLWYCDCLTSSKWD